MTEIYLEISKLTDKFRTMAFGLTTDENKIGSTGPQASVTSAVVDIEQKKSEEVKQQVKKKLRSFLQDLF